MPVTKALGLLAFPCECLRHAAFFPIRGVYAFSPENWQSAIHESLVSQHFWNGANGRSFDYGPSCPTFFPHSSRAFLLFANDFSLLWKTSEGRGKRVKGQFPRKQCYEGKEADRVEVFCGPVHPFREVGVAPFGWMSPTACLVFHR